MKEKIDFVVLWLDDKDKQWQKEKSKYSNKDKDKDKSDINRYRDWDNFKYWFRSVEKYANWVNKVYLITCGHLPKWLNVNHPKLEIVQHKDYIPNEFLPTFNSNVIELNLNRIETLSEQFVLFSDDMYILNDTSPSDFFKNGLPRDIYVEDLTVPLEYGDTYDHFLINNIGIINKHFNKKEAFEKYKDKYINPKYGEFNKKTQLLSHWNRIPGFKNPHLGQSFLKSTFFKVWEKEEEVLLNTCKNKFRNNTDVTQYLLRYWQLLEGNFEPTEIMGEYTAISDNNDKIIELMKSKKDKMICLNDVNPNIDFEKAKLEINTVFEEMLPDKSSYEI